MGFRIIDSHANALIECECGDVLSLSGERPTEKCDNCPHQYQIVIQVIDTFNSQVKYSNSVMERESESV